MRRGSGRCAPRLPAPSAASAGATGRSAPPPPAPPPATRRRRTAVDSVPRLGGRRCSGIAGHQRAAHRCSRSASTTSGARRACAHTCSARRSWRATASPTTARDASCCSASRSGLVVIFVPVALLSVLPAAYGAPPPVRHSLSTLLWLLGLLLMPVAMVGARRYRLSRTSWRGIRFSFRGRLRDFVQLFVVGTRAHLAHARPLLPDLRPRTGRSSWSPTPGSARRSSTSTAAAASCRGRSRG